MASEHRAIIHLDLDAFFAAVEVLENPELEGKPLLIGGRPEARGVVATASYPARVYGCRSAMPMARAVQLCPDAIILPARHGVYREYSQKVMAILAEATPTIEQVSIDEAFLDLTEQLSNWEEGITIAQRLQRRVREELGLSASLGVACNKQVAKVASDHDKPGGLTVVRPGEEAAFLAPLAARVLWGIGPVTAGKLQAMGIETVGQLAQMPEDALRAAFGRHGPAMALRAVGIDEQPVVVHRERKSVSQENTFTRDLVHPDDLKRELWRLSRGVARHLQRKDLASKSIAIKLRYSDFTTLTRQSTLAVPTDDERQIYRAALALLRQAWDRGRPVRLLGVGAHQLTQPSG